MAGAEKLARNVARCALGRHCRRVHRTDKSKPVTACEKSVTHIVLPVTPAK